MTRLFSFKPIPFPWGSAPSFHPNIGGAAPGAVRDLSPPPVAPDHPAAAIRRKAPFVHCITNAVTMQWMANGLLAAGARPIMVLDKAESPDMARHSDALLLNFGTWDPRQQESMLAATEAANEAAVPVVLDPVGAGGLLKRTEAALEILNTRQVAVIRGNGGEIVGLAGTAGLTRGVDSDVDPGRSVAVQAAARELARRYGCLVIATGRHDLVTDGDETWLVKGGHPDLQDVVGSGCLVGALVAAAAAATGNSAAGAAPSTDNSGPEVEHAEGPHRFTPRQAARTLLWCKFVGEQAAQGSRGPGSMAVAMLDEFATPRPLPGGRILPSLTDMLAVYVIVDGQTNPALVEDLVRAGVRAIQLRDKTSSLKQLQQAAQRFADVCRRHGALFFVNDHVDVALAADADGVHVGQEDLSTDVVRELIGPDKILGVSVTSVSEAVAAAEAGADYLGTGPVFETPTKPHAEPLGIRLLTEVREAVDIAQVAIAGIDAERTPTVLEAGADGVAVISAVLRADDPVAAAKGLKEAVERAKMLEN